MKTRSWIAIVVVLAIVIIVLAYLLFTTPAEAPTVNSRTTPTVQTTQTAATASASSTGPLDQQVSIATPKSGATVAHTFTVSGSAPNAWYFEAVFPIQVRDANDDLIASAQGRAQSDWTKPGPISFAASVTVDATYSGPATLILLKDNPSGIPENSDEVTLPIIIQ